MKRLVYRIEIRAKGIELVKRLMGIHTDKEKAIERAEELYSQLEPEDKPDFVFTVIGEIVRDGEKVGEYIVATVSSEGQI